ncbi:MAG TPA: TatD family hydrolase [Prolixibacteraceae bacterium]|jgi:TatD DNase family protein
MQKIDLHSHHPKSDSAIQILNAFAQDLPVPDDGNYYSAGLHPWHLGLVNTAECLQAVELAGGQKNVLAIGECGLDRSIDIDFATQEGYFRRQIEIAQQHCKPLIIHCVRAFPELVKLKKEYRSTIPWIIHGYQANRAITSELIRHNFYFSVGQSLLTNPLKSEIVGLLPADHLFLETDDREMSIDRIYSLAAQSLKIDEETLGSLILENFKRLFSNESVGLDLPDTLLL